MTSSVVVEFGLSEGSAFIVADEGSAFPNAVSNSALKKIFYQDSQFGFFLYFLGKKQNTNLLKHSEVR